MIFVVRIDALTFTDIFLVEIVGALFLAQFKPLPYVDLGSGLFGAHRE